MSDSDGFSDGSLGLGSSDDEGADAAQAAGDEVVPEHARAGRMRNLLADFYGIQKKDEAPSKAVSLSLDSDAFDSEAYVKGLLTTRPLDALLSEDNELCSQIKTLDSDMQMLVYENYNKFIAATDTIRSMKTNVESMQVEMTRLATSMEAVAKGSGAVNTSLASSRARIDKLVRVRRLVKRLSFLFELPARLQRSVELEAYSAAVAYYNTASDVLHKYQHMAAFRGLCSEADLIIEALKNKLRDVTESATAVPHKVIEATQLLLQLGDEAGPLRARACRALTRHSALALQGVDADVLRAAPVEAPLAELVSQLDAAYWPGAIDAARAYREAFVLPAPGKAPPADAKAAEAELHVALGAAHEGYLARAAAVLARLPGVERAHARRAAATVPEGDHAAETKAAAEARRAALGDLVDGLKRLSADCRRAAAELDEPSLVERCVDLIEGCVREQMVRSFAALRGESARRVATLHAKVAAAAAPAPGAADDATPNPFKARGAAAADCGDSPAGALASGVRGEGGYDDEAAAGRCGELLDGIAADLITAISATLHGIAPLVGVGSAAALAGGDASNAVHAGLVASNLWLYVAWLATACVQAAGVANPFSAADVACPSGGAGIRHLAGADAADDAAADHLGSAPAAGGRGLADAFEVSVPALPDAPLFCLLLASLLRDLQRTVLPEADRLLAGALSGDGDDGRASLGGDAELAARTGAAAGLLLAHYVELRGAHVGAPLRAAVRAGRDWRLGDGGMGGPSGPLDAAAVAVDAAAGVRREAAAALGEPMPAAAYAAALKFAVAAARDSALLGARGGVAVDMDRIFAQGAADAGAAVPFEADGIAAACARVAIKGWEEECRRRSFSAQGFAQTRLDCQLWKLALPLLVVSAQQPGGRSAEPDHGLEAMLEDVVTVAADRCAADDVRELGGSKGGGSSYAVREGERELVGLCTVRAEDLGVWRAFAAH